MGIFDPDEVITKYSIREAVDDGALVEVFKEQWDELSGGKPIVATASLFESVSLAGLIDILDEFVRWKKSMMPKHPEQERLFERKMNGVRVWVIEDDVAVTLMYPEDY